MKYFSLILFVSLVMLLNSSLHAQVTNLVINGSSSGFTMTSGDTIHWEFDVATGATVTGEFWYDVNNNGVIDPSTDKARFIFTQTDGDPSGSGGPPDLDGTANGHVIFYQRVGIGPGKYILRFTYNSVSTTRTGTVSALASPSHTISGHITPPSGKSPQYIFIEVRRNDQYELNSWDAATDASGNYSIQMNADTAGNPWRIRLADNSNPFPPSIITPDEISLVITGNHSGNNFTFTTAAAQVAGVVKDEYSVPIPFASVWMNSNDTSNIYFNGNTDASGFFQIGIPSSALHGQTWTLQADLNGGNVTTTNLQARVNLPVINLSDSLYRQLTIYSTNSFISGTVTVDGHTPGFTTQIFASSSDSGQAVAYIDSASGDFTIPVSNKIYNYTLMLSYLPFGWFAPNIIAHPGDNGIILNITTQQYRSVSYNTGWNMLSVPLQVFDFSKTSLFPNAVSAAYNYNGGYNAQPFLQNGVGYWMKFTFAGSSGINGYMFQQETLAVINGWNMIGALSDSFSTSNIVPVGTTIKSLFYGYNGGYFSTTTLMPGNAYWVKVSGAGQFILGPHNVPSSVKGRAAVLDNDLPPAPPGAEELSIISQPLTFALYENYPNPFNPATRISYDIPAISGKTQPSVVSLKVYDLLGREAATLVNERKQPGVYTISWDATNYPSGIYYYRLTAGNFTAIKKMILMK